MKSDNAKKLAFAASFLIIYYLVVEFLKQPVYMGVLALVAYIVVLILIFRATVLTFAGNVIYAGGNVEAAKLYFQKAINAKSKSARPYLNLAVLLMRDGHGEEALVLLEQAQNIKKLSILDEKSLMLSLGSCYWILGRIDEAIATLEEMRTKFDYVNAQVLSTLGYLYMVKDNIDMALELSIKATTEDPADPSGWDNLGQIYFRLDDMDKAKENFLKALELKDTLGDSLYFLGLLYEKQGNLTEAKSCFIKAKSAKITALNTVTTDEILEKYNEYVNFEDDTDKEEELETENKPDIEDESETENNDETDSVNELESED